ncbi:MAG: hypothetical protein JO165_06885 [Candidatus Eremiobacteraeota bacterium]|nr:hypothetical protein [Candidatus Eremiobacteraeota bacterium]
MRLFGRAVLVIVGAVLFTLVSIQFARVIDENIAMAHSLNTAQSEVRMFRAHRAMQVRELRRLSDPDGSVPEIHDRLHLVRPNEAIIYLRPSPYP